MFSRSKGAVDKMSIKDVLNTLKDVQVDIQQVKADVAKIPAMEQRVSNIEARLTAMEAIKSGVDSNKLNYETLNNTVTALQTKVKSISTVEQQYKDAVKKLEVQKLFHELMSKRWNIIIHGIKQGTNADGTIKWETRQEACDQVQDFMRNALKMDEEAINKTVITDAHRQTVRKPKRDKPLPLIFKLGSLIDKSTIYRQLKNLKMYNQGREQAEKVFVVMEHLPAEMQSDRMSLLPVFKNAKLNDSRIKCTWFADRETGEYCLKVGNVVHKPNRNINNVASD